MERSPGSKDDATYDWPNGVYGKWRKPWDEIRDQVYVDGGDFFVRAKTRRAALGPVPCLT